jgi:hypothetical protein
MSQTLRRACVFLLAAVVCAALASAAPAPKETNEVLKDRTGFIPNRKYFSLPGKTVGVLVSDVKAMMGQEGRGGPADAYGFSANLGSYRWMYVPVAEKPLIKGLTIQVGEKGDQNKMYPSLSMANPETVKQWDITVPYSLVEVEVNDTLGAPAIEGFVATKMKRLDDTKDYPLKVPEVVEELRKRYKDYVKEQAKAIDDAMSEAQKAAVKEEKPTGPRETTELFYITWVAETEHLRVHFRTTITDGVYQTIKIGGGVERPLDKEKNPFFAFPPPPPPPRTVKTGTSFGIEFGMGYEVAKSGKVDRTLTLPFQIFQRKLEMVPVLDRGAPEKPKEF